MQNKKLSLNLFMSCLEEKEFRVEFFYDRIKLYIDSANSLSTIQKLSPNNGTQEIIPKTLCHYETMNSMIDARQPDEAYLKKLRDAITGDYVITYVEFAMDILCDNEERKNKLRQLMNEILVFERKKRKAQFYHSTCQKNDDKSGEDTHYFGDRRKKEQEILVMYSDKFSKVDSDSYCVHIELRFSGSKILKDMGLYTIEDLIDSPHQRVWEQYLDLRDLSYTRLFSLAYPESLNLDKSTHFRRGQKIFNQYRSSQHLLMAHPDFSKAFSPIKNRRMFDSRLNKALG